jgi:hypothetical protein
LERTGYTKEGEMNESVSNVCDKEDRSRKRKSIQRLMGTLLPNLSFGIQGYQSLTSSFILRDILLGVRSGASVHALDLKSGAGQHNKDYKADWRTFADDRPLRVGTVRS